MNSSPVIAGTLSLLVPGLRQISAGAAKKGAAVILAVALAFLSSGFQALLANYLFMHY